MNKYFFYCIIIFTTISCSRYPTDVENALKLAGKNRPELEKVLFHYNEYQKDSLKYKAACFLIANMPYYNYYEGKILDQYLGIFESLALHKQSPQDIINTFTNKYGRFSRFKLQKKEDVQNVSCAYLIQNIEWSFRLWQEQPWGRNIGFDDFCEFILPYKIGDEPPTEWRQVFYEKYNHLLDSLRNSPDASDPFVAAYTIIQSLCNEEKHFTAILPDLPHVGPHILDKWRSGSCRDLTDLTIYILRSLGIVCGVDFLPILSLADTGHLWVFVLDKSGKTFTSDFLECNMLPSDKVRNYTPKVYRKTFSINKHLVSKMNSIDKSVHPFFTHPMFIDVTSLYTGRNPIKSVFIPDNKFYTKNVSKKIAYLCVPRKMDWQPIDWSIFNVSGIRFENVKVNTVFRIATWENNELLFKTEPFIVDTLGIHHFLKTESIEERVTLYSKYNPDVEFFTLRMINGVFEGSNEPSFESSETLFIVKNEPIRLLNRVQTHARQKYKYLRYKGRDNSYCDVAEISFFEHTDDSIPLSGIVIGTPNLIGYSDRNDYEKAVDGNPYTSFHYKEPSGGWVGLELEKPVCINKIIYTPRNRDNFVREGDIYELYYLNNEWVSLGKMTAISDSLLYDHVPTKTLLFLKNHTRGVEERPFTYENGQQVWW